MITKISQISVALLMCVASSTAFCSNRQITIIRHGEAEHNVGHFYSSNPDHPNYRVANLTALGQSQVAKTANKLLQDGIKSREIAAVFVSPLPRTRQTAQILIEHGVFDEAKLIVEPQVIEIQAGSLEGQHYDPETVTWASPHPNAVGDESATAIICRMQNFYHKAIKQYPDGDILVITHGSPSMRLIELLSANHIELHTAESVTLAMPNTIGQAIDCP